MGQIRFLADACLHEGIVKGCLRREPAMDFLGANDAGLESVTDPNVLALAAQDGRVVVSSDFASMPGHFGEFLEANGYSPGVILISQKQPVGPMIEELLMIWSASSTSDWENRIVEIPL